MSRRLACLALVSLTLTACGGSSTHPINLSVASARTTAAGTARFTLTIDGRAAGLVQHTQANGAASFVARKAHIYKVVPGSSAPQEIVLDGRYTYANENVLAALSDPNVRPWTRLDATRLPAAQRRDRIDDLDRVRALAYLVDGVVSSRRVDSNSGLGTHLRGRVEPRRLGVRVPTGERASMLKVIRSDYVERPFTADFWVDDQNRVVRVRVRYRTDRGGTFTIDGSFSDFGTRVDLTLPPAREIQNVTP